MPEPAEYLVAHIREALARDERTSELHVDVTVSGERLFVTGEVSTRERRDAIAALVSEHADGREVVNHVTVEAPGPPAGPEEIR